MAEQDATPAPESEDDKLIAALNDENPAPLADDDDGKVEVEVGPKKLRVDKEIKEAWDGQAAKTQAEREAIKADREAFAKERQASAQEAQTRQVFFKELAEVQNIDSQLEPYLKLTPQEWMTWADQDQPGAQKAQMAVQAMQMKRGQLVSGLQAKAQEQDGKARQAAAERVAQAERELPTKIKGWSPEKRTELERSAAEYGFAKQDIDTLAHDPRMWQVLNDAATLRALRAKAAKVAAAPPSDSAPPPEPPAKLPSRGNSGPQPLSDRQPMDDWARTFRKSMQKAYGRQ